MPRIFDNIEQDLLPALQQALEVADHADFCVGYFNLRGWKKLDRFVERWSGGEGNCCRLLVGMHRAPGEELRAAMGFAHEDGNIDNQTALRLKKKLAEDFREQLAIGTPTNEDEACLRRLARQIKDKKVVVKLFLRHGLHAKLYLLFRPDPVNPIVSFVGSSNLTLAGLSGQGELNVDVFDHDACNKLAKWFADRWDDRWCVDISQELVQIIEESWARDALIAPYHIYVKIAYHLSKEAREGLRQFRIPPEFCHILFEFQSAAVRIAAHHLNSRGGVLIGDVVGLGKTLMATALAKVFENDRGLSTLILCPKNLVPMWQWHADQYGLHAKVLSFSRVAKELPHVPGRFRLVLIDESHNLRNRQGQRYRAIQEFIHQTESKVIMLSATPYNKTFLDLANQLRLFITEERDLGIRPERLIREKGDIEFAKLQVNPRSLAAFEKSEYADDWRDLMRLYLVRRTRSFIQVHYAQTDATNARKYLTFHDGSRSYFPARIPKTVRFRVNPQRADDQYARLYADNVVDSINRLTLPRYGLGNYLEVSPGKPPNQAEARVIQDLSRAGRRLMGFCRTNLFKRLESSGQAFIQSVQRHILRNRIFLYALTNDLPLPIGTQDAEFLDSRFADDDESGLFENDESSEFLETSEVSKAAEVYALYAEPFKRRFKWLPASLFQQQLATDLEGDIRALANLLEAAGPWDPARDAKLTALTKLLIKDHPQEKVLVFTQFADTVEYLTTQLGQNGILSLAGATGASANPTALAWRFSPESNRKRDQVRSDTYEGLENSEVLEEVRVLIATDVLSEGQNLQDCAIVVNYDLPWAIIRLIQRAGRVDRIGQRAENILCYSFLPADGVERIIRLRARVRRRLQENAEVVGTDEAFFEDDRREQAIYDLYHEKAGILDGDDDAEVDLASSAYQIWKDAITLDPTLEQRIETLLDAKVVYATRPHEPAPEKPAGVLVYLRTAEENDALAWVDTDGANVTQSQFAILKAAECAPDTKALPRQDNHHELVSKAALQILRDEKTVGGALGRPSGARFRVYERLKRHAETIKGTLFESQNLLKSIEEIYRFPLRPTAIEVLNRQLRTGIADDDLAQLVISLREDDRLSLIHEEEQTHEPRIICSLGLRDN
ncbi:MAG TPA: helicase-related protein [Verrucomicrobiae bacterium]|nr:helicase-related protein [Verrucomicrobiae bacterium]